MKLLGCLCSRSLWGYMKHLRALTFLWGGLCGGSQCVCVSVRGLCVLSLCEISLSFLCRGVSVGLFIAGLLQLAKDRAVDRLKALLCPVFLLVRQHCPCVAFLLAGALGSVSSSSPSQNSPLGVLREPAEARHGPSSEVSVLLCDLLLSP